MDDLYSVGRLQAMSGEGAAGHQFLINLDGYALIGQLHLFDQLRHVRGVGDLLFLTVYVNLHLFETIVAIGNNVDFTVICSRRTTKK